MLPDSLRSSYKEYKADSEAIANWLATTARDRGYKLQNIATDPEKIQQAGKLKGRARKLARQAANTGQCADAPQPNATPDSTNCTPRRLIPVSEFVKLAIFIAKSKPSITIDETISSKLKAAIDERKRHHVYHTENSKYESNSGVSNDGHGYFISILESVWNILQPHFVKTPLSEQLPQSKAAGSQCVNSFEELRVEEASDTIENETTTEEPVSLADAPVEFGVKQDAQTDLEESFFAWQCLLGDYKRLRHYLQCIWKNYKNGLFDLSAVSIVSNTAIDFARGIEEEFTSLFPQADTEKFMSVIYWYECESAGIDPDARERPTDYINLAVYDAIEPWLIPIHQLLSAYGGILQSNILPAIKRGFHGIYDPSTDRSAKTNREKYLEAKIVLLEALPEFTVIAMHSDRIYAEDEIIRGMRQLVKTKKPSMWFTLACQIFLDIHHILRHEVSRGMSDLETVAKFVKTGIKSVLDFHKDLRTDSWPRKNDRYLTDLLGYINLWVDNDIIEWMRCRNIEGSNTAKPSSFFLLKQHPLLCGLMIFTIKLWSQHTGIMFANAWHSVLHCAHLYNAIRQERLLADPWKDMNLVLHAHKTETIFVGSFPRTNDDYCRRYYLAIGVSATILAKDNDRAIKNGWIRESKSGPRSLDWLCPVSRSIRRRYCEDAGLLTLSPADIERILTENALNVSG